MTDPHPRESYETEIGARRGMKMTCAYCYCVRDAFWGGRRWLCADCYETALGEKPDADPAGQKERSE